MRLYLCKRILMNYGGMLSGNKRKDGSKGSTFKIQIPAEVAESQIVSNDEIEVE